MSFSIVVDRQVDQTVVLLHGRFNHETHVEFKELVRSLKEEGLVGVSVDLSAVKEMDSSGLGLLLLLRDALGGKRAQIRIRGASGAIRRILEVANFQRFFLIE